jgi:hypothetical protein
LLVFVEEAHRDSVMPLREGAGGVRFGHGVDHATVDVEALDQLVQVLEGLDLAEIDQVPLRMPFPRRLANDDDVELLAGIDAHGAPEPARRLIQQHPVTAEREHRGHVELPAEIRPGDSNLEVVEPVRVPSGPVVLQDGGRIDLGAEELADAVPVDRSRREVRDPSRTPENLLHNRERSGADGCR